MSTTIVPILRHDAAPDNWADLNLPKLRDWYVEKVATRESNAPVRFVFMSHDVGQLNAMPDFVAVYNDFESIAGAVQWVVFYGEYVTDDNYDNYVFVAEL